MDKIALRYTSTALSDLTYNSSASQQEIFMPLTYYRPAKERVVKRVVTRRGRIVEHEQYKRKIHEITISADQIMESDLPFLESFWEATFKYIAIYTGRTWETDHWEDQYDDYIEVVPDDDTFPVDYINGIKYLPEVKLTLSETEGY